MRSIHQFKKILSSFVNKFNKTVSRILNKKKKMDLSDPEMDHSKGIMK